MSQPFCSYRKFGLLLVTNIMSTIDYYLDCIDHISACFPYCFPLMYPRLSHYLQILWLMTYWRVAEACLACLYYIAVDNLVCMHIEKRLTLICQPPLQWAHSQFSLVDRNTGRYYVLNVQLHAIVITVTMVAPMTSSSYNHCNYLNHRQWHFYMVPLNWNVWVELILVAC